MGWHFEWKMVLWYLACLLLSLNLRKTMAWLCDMRSTWLWWPKCNQVWAWLESGLAYPSIARMSMAKRSFHSMAQYLGFVKAPEKDSRDYSVVFEVGFKVKDLFHLRQTVKTWYISDAGFVGHKGGQTPEVGGLTGMPFLPATWFETTQFVYRN